MKAKFFSSLQIIFNLFVLVLVYEGKARKITVRFDHFSSMCWQLVHERRKVFETCVNTPNKIKCGEWKDWNPNSPDNCKERRYIRKPQSTASGVQEIFYKDLPGYQLVPELKCNQDQVVYIQSVVYQSPKQYHQFICPYNIKECNDLEHSNCKQINCTTRVKLSGVEKCEMEDKEVTLHMRRQCYSGSTCTYKLPRKLVAGYSSCRSYATTGLGNSITKHCKSSQSDDYKCGYAVAAYINYTCTGTIHVQI